MESTLERDVKNYLEEDKSAEQDKKITTFREENLRTIQMMTKYPNLPIDQKKIDAVFDELERM